MTNIIKVVVVKFIHVQLLNSTSSPHKKVGPYNQKQQNETRGDLKRQLGGWERLLKDCLEHYVKTLKVFGLKKLGTRVQIPL